MRANEDLILRTPLVQLVPYREEHVPRYHEWMADAHLRAATASERLTLHQELDMCREWARDSRKCTFIVRDASTSTMIGDCNFFFNDVDDDDACEIEVMIAERGARRRGAAREALEVFMAYGAVELGTTTFTAKIGYENVASNALFRGLGYEEKSRSDVFEETTYELRARDDAGNAKARFRATWARVEWDSYDAFEARRRAGP